MRQNYYSLNWSDATEKFVRKALVFGNLKFTVSDDSKFDIPWVSIGSGLDKIVINSGVHGIEGFFGSAAQSLFLSEVAPKLSAEFLKKYTLVLIHVINGWGMENRMREVPDPDGGLVDLNRNFGIDFSNPSNLPKNDKYGQAHKILLSMPHVRKGEKTKMHKLLEFRRNHLHDGVWDSIMRGQYGEPYGLAYGGATDMPENKMTMHIYDEIMQDAKSLISIGLHTGLGRFYKKMGAATLCLQVSHPSDHPNTVKFKEIFQDSLQIAADENAVYSPSLLGDLVDCLELRYADKNIPIYTADLEIGTGQWPIRSQVLKRMDMGDARYDLLNYGEINSITRRNLTESWYPSDIGWRRGALQNAKIFFAKLTDYLENKART